MSKKINKKDINVNTTLVELYFLFKGKGNLRITTTILESCDFVDFLNKNNALFNSYKVEDKKKKQKFEYKYYTFMDYKEKCSITINLSDIKYFKIPFYIENDDKLEFRFLEVI